MRQATVLETFDAPVSASGAVASLAKAVRRRPAARTVVACGPVVAGAPLIPVPTRPLELVPAETRLAGFPARLCTLPGLRQAAPFDLMRGEETRIAGFLSLNRDWDGVICLPGTQTRWAQLSAGEIVSFQTFVTDEIIQAMAVGLGANGRIGRDLDSDAFAEALGDCMSKPERLAARLFSLRAGKELGQITAAVAYSRLAGLLIGAELAAARPYWLGRQVAVVGAAEAALPYVEALAHQGVPATRADGDRMTLAGLTGAWRRLPA